jgi:hypothetical protein
MRQRPLTCRLPLVVLGLCWSSVAAGVALAAGTAADGWRWPLAGVPVVVRGFDPPPVPWAPGHRGVDLRAISGADVFAAGSGVVGFAGMLAGRGVATVQHGDGLETTYEPLAVAVRPGEPVAAGQLIGRLQPGHGDCGIGYVCLHWGLRRGDVYLDPLQLVRPQRLRLLPIWPSGAAARAAAPAAAAPAVSASPDTRSGSSSARMVGAAATVAVVGAAATTVAVGGAAALVAARRRRVAPP